MFNAAQEQFGSNPFAALVGGNGGSGGGSGGADSANPQAMKQTHFR